MPDAFEPELEQPPPRRLRPRVGLQHGCAQWLPRLFILPHVAVGVGLAVVFVYSVILYVVVLVAGTNVEGRVVRKTSSHSKSGTTYTIHYVFAHENVEYPGHVSVSKSVYDSLTEGEPVAVRVFHPTLEHGVWPRVPGHYPIASLGGMLGVALFWNGIVSVFVWHLYILPWRTWRLFRHGLPAHGVVRQVESCRVNKQPGIKIQYDYHVENPETGEQKSWSGCVRVPVILASDAHSGEAVTVLYDPQRPGRSVLYRYGDYEVRSPDS